MNGYNRATNKLRESLEGKSDGMRADACFIDKPLVALILRLYVAFRLKQLCLAKVSPAAEYASHQHACISPCGSASPRAVADKIVLTATSTGTRFDVAL